MAVFDPNVFDPVVFDTGPAVPAGPTLIVSTVESPVPTIDLVELALSRLPHQYRGSNG